MRQHDKLRLPQWKLFFEEGYETLRLDIQEELKSYQFCYRGLQDFKQIVGKISCKSCIQSNPEVTVPLSGVFQHLKEHQTNGGDLENLSAKLATIAKEKVLPQ